MSTPIELSILILIDQIYASTGGTEQHVSFLLQLLPLLGINISFVLLRDTGYRDINLYPIAPMILDVHSFSSPLRTYSSCKKLSKIIHDRHINIVHTFFTDSEILGILATQLGRNTTLIASRRNMGHLYTPLQLWRLRATNHFVPHFLANCIAVKNQLINREFVSPSKIHVIYNPVNHNRIQQGLRNRISRANIGLEAQHEVVGLVANVRPVKDHETFLRAAQLVLLQRPRVKFVLVGGASSEDRESLFSMISLLGLEEAVIYAGAYDNPVRIMSLFDVGVLSSKAEGLSNSLIEYSALGLPSVATDVGGNGEIVLDGLTGFLVPPSNPAIMAQRILQLLENRGTSQTFGKNARAYVENKFGQESVLDSYNTLYNAVCNS